MYILQLRRAELAVEATGSELIFGRGALTSIARFSH
jgi:hypothetical protein